MNSQLEALVLGGILLASFLLVLWGYWNIALPVLRQRAAFNIERQLDALRILGLQGKLEPTSKVYLQVCKFLKEAFNAAQADGWIMVSLVPHDKVEERKTNLMALINDMDSNDPEIRRMVNRTLRQLVSIYVMQRPMMLVCVSPLIVLSYFREKSHAFLHKKELQYAAQSLCAA